MHKKGNHTIPISNSSSVSSFGQYASLTSTPSSLTSTPNQTPKIKNNQNNSKPISPPPFSLGDAAVTENPSEVRSLLCKFDAVTKPLDKHNIQTDNDIKNKVMVKKAINCLNLSALIDALKITNIKDNIKNNASSPDSTPERASKKARIG